MLATPAGMTVRAMAFRVTSLADRLAERLADGSFRGAGVDNPMSFDYVSVASSLKVIDHV